MIMWQRIAQLKEEIGEDDFDEVVTLFLEEVEEVIARMQQGFDPETIGADLHFLKGSALNLGFRHFAGLCAEGEHAAQAGRADPAQVERVIAAFEESRAAFIAGLAQQEDRRAG